MHDFVLDLKNLYSSAEAASFKFPMGTASLMKVMKDANLVTADNDAFWELYLAVDADPRLAMELRAREHNLEMLALHNSLMTDAIKDYAKSYSQGNTNAYPSTSKMVARNLTDNYSNITVTKTTKNQRRNQQANQIKKAD